jgi:hypothetical protein
MSEKQLFTSDKMHAYEPESSHGQKRFFAGAIAEPVPAR